MNRSSWRLIIGGVVVGSLISTACKSEDEGDSTDATGGVKSGTGGAGYGGIRTFPTGGNRPTATATGGNRWANFTFNTSAVGGEDSGEGGSAGGGGEAGDAGNSTSGGKTGNGGKTSSGGTAAVGGATSAGGTSASSTTLTVGGTTNAGGTSASSTTLTVGGTTSVGGTTAAAGGSTSASVCLNDNVLTEPNGEISCSTGSTGCAITATYAGKNVTLACSCSASNKYVCKYGNATNVACPVTVYDTPAVPCSNQGDSCSISGVSSIGATIRLNCTCSASNTWTCS